MKKPRKINRRLYKFDSVTDLDSLYLEDDITFQDLIDYIVEKNEPIFQSWKREEIEKGRSVLVENLISMPVRLRNAQADSYMGHGTELIITFKSWEPTAEWNKRYSAWEDELKKWEIWYEANESLLKSNKAEKLKAKKTERLANLEAERSRLLSAVARLDSQIKAS